METEEYDVVGLPSRGVDDVTSRRVTTTERGDGFVEVFLDVVIARGDGRLGDTILPVVIL